MAETLNLYQKLAKIRKQVEILKNDTKAYGYNYVKEETILAKITAFMEKYDISLVPGVVPNTLKVEPYTYKKTKVTSKGERYDEWGNEVLVSADTTWTWVNNKNPEENIEVKWAMVGQQTDASQSFGSGLTYSSRYFLLKYFNVSTSDDDPDSWRSKQRVAEAAEEKAIAEQVIKKFDEEVRSFLGTHQDKGADVKAFVTKYVKNGDYFAITESVLASKLLTDFKEKFLKEDK